MPERHDDKDPIRTEDDAPAQHGGSEVKQGMHGQSTREAARGRTEFQGRGESSQYDEGRSSEAGRHYGRSGTEEPGPGYGRGPLQPGGEVIEGEEAESNGAREK